MQNRRTPLRRADRMAASALTLLLLLTTALAAAPAALAALAGTVIWDQAPRNISNSNVKTVFPWVDMDSNSKAHVIFSNDNGQLLYTNNVGGAFSPPQEIEEGLESNRDPFYAIAVGPDNRLHVAYSTVGGNFQVYYRQGTLNGATATWSPRQQISTGSKSFAAHIAVDLAGNAHIVWIDNRCGTYNVFHRIRSADGSLSGVTGPKADCKYQNRPQVVVTNDGKAHVIFQYENEIYYSRLEGGSWVSQNISNSSSTNSGNSTAATDGVGIYAAWDEGVNGHDIQFRASRDGGQNWSNIISFSNTPQFASFPNATWSPASRRVYVAWSDVTGAEDGRTEVWFREFDPVTGDTTEADRLTHMGGDSLLPVVAAGSARAEVVWEDKIAGFFQAWGWSGAVLGGGCEGSLALTGTTTRNRNVRGTITPRDSCVPDQMQISVDTPISDSTPKVPYQATIDVTLPAGDCVTHTVYVRLFKGGVAGNTFNDTITLDSEVDAYVTASNPHISGLPTVYSDVGTKDLITEGGASNGDPRYTRDEQFFLGIINQGDCTGLKSFSITDGIGETGIEGGRFEASVALPMGNFRPGTKSFSLVISDTVGNRETVPLSLIYDPADTDPSPDVNNTEGLPNLVGGSFGADTKTKSVIRTLNFVNVRVNDNLYDADDDPDNQNDFWGVWVANSPPNQDIGADDPSLKWFPVEVRQPDRAFSISWNLFRGQSFGAALNRPGTYFVYVQFLDGAGNPSGRATALKAQVTLDPGYQLPSVFTPIIRKAP